MPGANRPDTTAGRRGGRRVLRMTCPQCGREQEHPASLAGLRVRCPGCDGWLPLPAPAERSGAFAAPATGFASPASAFPSGGPPHPEAIADAPAALSLLAEPGEAEIFCPRCCVVNVVRRQPGPQTVVC